MIEVKCPNCAAIMEIDDNRKFAFCTFCGTKIITTTTVDRSSEINNYLSRAYEYEERKEYSKALDYCNRVLDIDSTNEYARDLEKRLSTHKAINNVIIKYISSINNKFKLRVTLDGKTWYTIEPNSQIEFILPIGDYNIMFAGKKTYVKKINIEDSRKIINITYIAENFRNHIIIE